MKPTERRKQLLEWLEKEGTLSLAEMVTRFEVTKMTIHRDLGLLERRQALKRIHGGAARLENGTQKGDSHKQITSAQGNCLICYRPPTQQLLYTITKNNGEQQVACCPHCGISAQLMMGDQIAMALTTDFLSGRLHAAQHSFFVLGSVVVPCCKPSILTFSEAEISERFQKGFGGTLGRFEDAIEFLRKDMSIHDSEGCPHCSGHATPLGTV